MRPFWTVNPTDNRLAFIRTRDWPTRLWPHSKIFKRDGIRWGVFWTSLKSLSLLWSSCCRIIGCRIQQKHKTTFRYFLVFSDGISDLVKFLYSSRPNFCRLFLIWSSSQFVRSTFLCFQKLWTWNLFYVNSIQFSAATIRVQRPNSATTLFWSGFEVTFYFLTELLCRDARMVQRRAPTTLVRDQSRGDLR